MGTLLTERDGASFTVMNSQGRSPVFLTCDHASSAIPHRLQNLGLDADTILSHRGWDIGALSMSRNLSDFLDSPLVYSGFSRLVIDCNRPCDAPQSIPQFVDGVYIPMNMNLSESDIKERQIDIFYPYHDAVQKTLKNLIHRVGKVFYLAIHSFTPQMGGEDRPWEIGVTYEKPSSFSGHLIRSLVGQDDLEVGVNQPYPITREGDYGIHVHGDGNGLESVLIEIRQDLLIEKRSYQRVFKALGTAISQVL